MNLPTFAWLSNTGTERRGLFFVVYVIFVVKFLSRGE
jgi:hypothetical protein